MVHLVKGRGRGTGINKERMPLLHPRPSYRVGLQPRTTKRLGFGEDVAEGMPLGAMGVRRYRLLTAEGLMFAD